MNTHRLRPGTRSPEIRERVSFAFLPLRRVWPSFSPRALAAAALAALFSSLARDRHVLE